MDIEQRAEEQIAPLVADTAAIILTGIHRIHTTLRRVAAGEAAGVRDAVDLDEH